MVESRSHAFILCVWMGCLKHFYKSYGNCGFEVIVCSVTQTSFIWIDNTGGQTNFKKVYVDMLDSNWCFCSYPSLGKILLMQEILNWDHNQEFAPKNNVEVNGSTVLHLYPISEIDENIIFQQDMQFFLIIQDYKMYLKISQKSFLSVQIWKKRKYLKLIECMNPWTSRSRKCG